MLSTLSSPPTLNRRGMLLSVIPTLIIDGACPLIIYLVLKPSTTDVIALGAASLPPALSNIVSFARHRRLDVLGILILLGIVVSMGAILITGDPRLLLIRESFLTGALGLACLVSLLFPRPLMFYFSRHFVAGNNPTRIEAYNAFWQYPQFRRLTQLVTGVWGIAFVGEFVLRVILIFTLSITQVLLISPIVLNAITIGLGIWTTFYSASVWRRGRQAAAARAAQVQTVESQHE